MSTMRIGGLASGMDIESLVEKLMVAERAPLDKLEQKKQTYEWQRDAYREINTKLKNFDTYLADNFFLKNLNAKTATSSNEKYVTAVATNAATGTLTIESVYQLAKAARGIGKQVNATGTTTLAELFNASGITMPDDNEQYIEIRAIQKDGTLASKATKIEYKRSMTINEFIQKVNSSGAGVTAVFENGRLSITANYTGEVKGGNEIVIGEGSGSEIFRAFGFDNPTNIVTEKGKNAVFQVNGIVTERSTNSFNIAGYSITLKDTFNSEKAVNALLVDALNDFKFAKDKFDTASSVYDAKNQDFQTAQADFDVVFNQLDPTEQEQYNTFNKTFLKNLTDDDIAEILHFDLSGEDPLANIPDDHELKKQLSKLSPEELNILDNLSEEQLKDFRTVADKEIAKNQAEQELNVAEANKEKASEELNSAFHIFKELYFNNNFASEEIENMTDEELQNLFYSFSEAPQLNEPINQENAVTLTSSTNVDDIIDRIKEFVKTYNELITELNNKINEPKYRDYQPLTTLQRKEMENKEIELWEQKAKSGLLRGDDILREGLSSIRSLIYQSNPALPNTKYNTLYSIGINTTKNYLSGGTLEIDESKLRAALEEDPDAVVQLLTMNGDEKAKVTVNGETKTVDTRGFLRKIRAEIDKIELKIEQRAGRAAMNETQYTLGKYLRDINQRIKDWQDRLTGIEQRYWTRFTQMEKMISQANSQSSMLMGQFYSNS
ncbi:flagellar filament capping protein FliD [Ureibacillus thermophilus]|uniref:flagellar filament capping protein FliD n=1 Tax=Ureibacillus thermophilus TaxID=367743 RepID=UPI00361E506E